MPRFGFDSRSGCIQESTNECISKWENKSMFLSLSLSLSLSVSLCLSLPPSPSLPLSLSKISFKKWGTLNQQYGEISKMGNFQKGFMLTSSAGEMALWVAASRRVSFPFIFSQITVWRGAPDPTLCPTVDVNPLCFLLSPTCFPFCGSFPFWLWTTLRMADAGRNNELKKCFPKIIIIKKQYLSSVERGCPVMCQSKTKGSILIW